PPRAGGGAGGRGAAVHLQREGVTPVLGPGSRRLTRFGETRGPSAGGIQLRGRDRAGRREELPTRLHGVDSPVRRGLMRPGPHGPRVISIAAGLARGRRFGAGTPRLLASRPL